MPTFTHIAQSDTATWSDVVGLNNWKNAAGTYVAGPGNITTGNVYVNLAGYQATLDSPGSMDLCDIYNEAPFGGANTTSTILNVIVSGISVGAGTKYIFRVGVYLIVPASANCQFFGNCDFYDGWSINSGGSLGLLGSINNLYLIVNNAYSINGSIQLGGNINLYDELDFSTSEYVGNGGTINLMTSFADVITYQSQTVLINGDILPSPYDVKAGVIFDGGSQVGGATPSTFLPFTSAPTSIGPYNVGTANVGPYPVK